MSEYAHKMNKILVPVSLVALKSARLRPASQHFAAAGNPKSVILNLQLSGAVTHFLLKVQPDTFSY